MDAEQQRDRLTRLEERFGGVERGFRDLQHMIKELGQELRAASVPRGEYEERAKRQDERTERLEARIRDEAKELAAIRDKLEALATRAPPTAGIPPWVATVGSLLIGLVTLLGGALLGMAAKKP